MVEHRPKPNRNIEPTAWSTSGDLRDPNGAEDFLRLGPAAAKQLLETARHPDYERHYRELAQKKLAEAAFQSLGLAGAGGFGVVEGEEGRYYVSLRPDDLGTRIASEDLERHGLPELGSSHVQASHELEETPEQTPSLEEAEPEEETAEVLAPPVANERLSHLAGEVKMVLEDGERILDGVRNEGSRLNEAIDVFEEALRGSRSAVNQIRDVLDTVIPANIQTETGHLLTRFNQLVANYAETNRRVNQLIDDGAMQADQSHLKMTMGNVGEIVHKEFARKGISDAESRLYERVNGMIDEVSGDIDRLSYVTPADTDTFPSASSLDIDVIDLQNALIHYSEGSASQMYVRDAVDRLDQAFSRLQGTLDELLNKRSKFDADTRKIKDSLGSIYEVMNSASRELPQTQDVLTDAAPATQDEVTDEDFSEKSVLQKGDGGYWTPDQENNPTYLEARRAQFRRDNPRQ